jgi:hypothetical protein
LRDGLFCPGVVLIQGLKPLGKLLLPRWGVD